jgi:hypothetical protein
MLENELMQKSTYCWHVFHEKEQPSILLVNATAEVTYNTRMLQSL